MLVLNWGFGVYKWNDEKFEIKIKEFFNKLGMHNTSDKNIWSIILLLYPTKGIIKITKKNKKDFIINEIKCKKAFDVLGYDDILLYKGIADESTIP